MASTSPITRLGGLARRLVQDGLLAEENAARATGINVRRQRMWLYTISGLMAGIAGLIFTARVNTGDPTAGLTYETIESLKGVKQLDGFGSGHAVMLIANDDGKIKAEQAQK